MAEAYDQFLVPLVFELHAVDLAGRVARSEPRRILETAAGTGALTRAMASRLPPGSSLIVTDLHQTWLDHAAARQGLDERIQWRQADALKLPFEDQSFDVVVCQFGAMFFSDKVQGFLEARRVLEPGGRFVFNVFDRISENEFANGVTEALATLFPNDPPRFMARTPHGYCDADKIREHLTEAGFSTISVEAVDKRSLAKSPWHAAIAFCQGTPLRNEIEARGGPGLEDSTNRTAAALAARFGEGPIEGRTRAFVFDVMA
jgi:ubiquinone/menaquinone biosynthesis C-methylase UbiE